MANGSIATTNNLVRLLQLGVDDIIRHTERVYAGVGKQLFTAITHKKAFYEAYQIAGMGLAAIKGQGGEISLDSVDQNWSYTWPMVTYGKGGRITKEAIAFNLYEDLVSLYGKEIAKSLMVSKDAVLAALFNNLFSTTNTPDAVAPISASHPLQAGGTTSNILSPGMNFGEDALEQMITLVDNLKNPDGIESDYVPDTLVYHTALRFEVARVLGNPDRPATADRDINVVQRQGIIKRDVAWKRLTDQNAFFLMTDADKGFKVATAIAMETVSEKAPGTSGDILVYASETYVPFLEDFRAVIGSAGAT